MTSSFMRFYKAKIVNHNAISKQAEDNIRTDAYKVHRLVTDYLAKLEEIDPVTGETGH